MKTTSYEISKKLKEEGFEAQSSFFWCELDKDLIRIHISQSHCVPESIDKIKAYDLETILDALPEKIKYKEEEYCFWMQWSGSSDCYIMGYVHGNLRATELEVWREDEDKNSESLADTAGKMWLLLKEKGVL